jgi:hypothetical protein
MPTRTDAVELAIRTELVMPGEAEAPAITREGRVDVTDKEHAAVRIKDMEELLLEQSMTVVQGAMSFGELPFDAQEAPDSWVEELGQEAADKKFRYLKAGQMCSKDAPSGVKVAAGVATGILKARAARGMAPVLNLQFVVLSKQEPRDYPVQNSDG